MDVLIILGTVVVLQYIDTYIYIYTHILKYVYKYEYILKYTYTHLSIFWSSLHMFS